MLEKIKELIKKDTVLFISALIAGITVFLVPPDAEYLGYIDFRVLGLLLCLMAVVAGFKNAGVFNWLTYQLLNRIKSGRILALTLIMLPFFSSMLVTNDVALIIFIPFTISLLTESGCKRSLVPIIVMQTVAANLGSMATPIGNPQNLFLYSAYNLYIGDFFSVTLPLTAICFIMLVLISPWLLPKTLDFNSIAQEKINSRKSLIIFALLFILSLLTVFRIIPYQLTTLITVIVILITDKKLFNEIDFMLLLTFVCFFVISENLGRLEIVRNFLQTLLEKNTLLTSVGTSQIISNVPAAVLLSAFTDNWRELLSGVNIGGLGTPIASLASLITLKLYTKTHDAKIIKFLSVFSLVNLIGIFILLGFEFLI